MPRTRTGWDAYLYALTIFVSAFLLFQVQPIIAKMILPWFGGTSAVWSTCMLFFQLTLLMGYLYAHLLHRMPSTRQAVVHSALLVASLIVLPILPNPAWKPAEGSNPSLLILGLLAVTIGLPYMILSATSPLLQSWYAARSGAVPYRLFALSNLASMMALLTYPVLIEPNLSVRTQSYVWSTLYVCFAVACVATAWMAARTQVSPTSEGGEPEGAAPTVGLRLLWIGLAACASTLLLAVTTFLTQDIAPIPFLWVLPLAAYLLSFIVCFESPGLYHRAVFLPLLVLSLFGLAYLLARDADFGMKTEIGLVAAAFFVCCMVCHGELARLKPHPSRLTGFYVMVSVGGAVGGLFAGLLAPHVFNSNYEYPVALVACAALAAWVVVRASRNRILQATLAAAVLAYAYKLGTVTRAQVTGYRAVARNFYGELRVEDVPARDEEHAYRTLLHGTTDHGVQMLAAKYRRTPVAYFCPASGIGRAMAARPAGARWRVAILGLGAGALAPYGQAGDVIRIYEINPVVLDLANSDFTYLKDTPAKVEVSLGDGRLSLERETGGPFDMLVVDAFSGDSVPVHLLTKEAFALYFQHLKPGGMLVANISNAYLNLEPVMAQAASYFAKRGLIFDVSVNSKEVLCYSSTWAVLVDPAGELPESLRTGRLAKSPPGFRMWTDDFSNMFSVLW